MAASGGIGNAMFVLSSITWPIVIATCTILRLVGYTTPVIAVLLTAFVVYGATSLGASWNNISRYQALQSVLLRPCTMLAIITAVLLSDVSYNTDEPWYKTYNNHRALYFYFTQAVLVVVVVGNVAQFLGSGTGREGNALFFDIAYNARVYNKTDTNLQLTNLQAIVYTRRCRIMNAIVALCAIVSVYYIDVVVGFVCDNDALSMRETTYFSSLNKTECAARDNAVEDYDDALYSEELFTPECAVLVWARNRTNILVWLQFVVVFSLLIGLPTHQKTVAAAHKAAYALCIFVGDVCLAGGVITTLDLLTDWYEVETTGAVLFVAYACTRIAAAWFVWKKGEDTSTVAGLNSDSSSQLLTQVKLKL